MSLRSPSQETPPLIDTLPERFWKTFWESNSVYFGAVENNGYIVPRLVVRGEPGAIRKIVEDLGTGGISSTAGSKKDMILFGPRVSREIAKRLVPYLPEPDRRKALTMSTQRYRRGGSYQYHRDRDRMIRTLGKKALKQQERDQHEKA